MREEVIKAEGSTRVFNRNLVAVDYVTFSVYEGGIFGFLGPNGAGKTTTIKMLITALKPTEGAASVMGYDVVKQAGEVLEMIASCPRNIPRRRSNSSRERFLATSRGIP